MIDDDIPAFELTSPVHGSALRSHLSLNQLAQLTGIDRSVITRRLRGLAYHEGPHKAKLYDSIEALPAIYGVTDDSSDALNPQREKALLDRERRQLTALERQRKAGELVSVDSVRADWLAIIAIARNRLLALPSRIAPDLAGVGDVRAIDDTLRAAIHEILEEMAGDVRSGDTA